jgi:hypothetical protein
LGACRQPERFVSSAAISAQLIPDGNKEELVPIDRAIRLEHHPMLLPNAEHRRGGP